MACLLKGSIQPNNVVYIQTTSPSNPSPSSLLSPSFSPAQEAAPSLPSARLRRPSLPLPSLPQVDVTALSLRLPRSLHSLSRGDAAASRVVESNDDAGKRREGRDTVSRRRGAAAARARGGEAMQWLLQAGPR